MWAASSDPPPSVIDSCCILQHFIQVWLFSGWGHYVCLGDLRVWTLGKSYLCCGNQHHHKSAAPQCRQDESKTKRGAEGRAATSQLQSCSFKPNLRAARMAFQPSPCDRLPPTSQRLVPMVNVYDQFVQDNYKKNQKGKFVDMWERISSEW